MPFATLSSIRWVVVRLFVCRVDEFDHRKAGDVDEVIGVAGFFVQLEPLFQ